MLTFLSSKLRFLLILCLFILGISFIFFDHGHLSGGSSPSNPKVATIAGKTIKRSDFEASLRATKLIYILQTGRQPDSQLDRIFRSQTWNRLLVLQAAKEAKIRPSTAEAIDFIKKHPLFQDAQGTFSPIQYKNFNDLVLQPQGISDEVFQEIIQDQIAFEQMLQSLTSTISVSQTEVEETYQGLYGSASLQYVQLAEASLRAEISLSPEELQSYHQQNQNRFLSPELRRLDYVLFKLSPEQLKLPEEKKKAELRLLMQKAFQFTEPFFNTEGKADLPNFQQAALAAGLSSQQTPPLTRRDLCSPASPPPNPSLNWPSPSRKTPPSAIIRRWKMATSVLHLAEVQPASLLPFEKVRKEVEQAALAQKTKTLLEEKGRQMAKDLQSALASGQSWSQATAALNLKSINVPAFSPAKDNTLNSPAAEAIRFWAQRLKVGAVSEFSRIADGGVVLYLSDRKPPVDTNRESLLKGIEEQLQQQRRYQVLDEWITARTQAKGTQIPADLLAGEYGQNL
ncbi:MAG: hypothetical protein HC904_12585 [Blastochloris sp.]|nr:hypothetical protein [Blastochloris sp.]